MRNEPKLSQDEFMQLIKESGEYDALEAFRMLWASGFPYHEEAIRDNFMRGQILWAIEEKYGEPGKYHFHYTGSNPEERESRNRRYRNGLLHYQITHYKYHVRFGYYAPKDYANLPDFIKQNPEYELGKIHKAFRLAELDHRENGHRPRYAFGSLEDFQVPAWAIQKDPFFSGEHNNGKDNYTTVPIFWQRDAKQVKEFLELREPDHQVYFVYWKAQSGVFRYDPFKADPFSTLAPSISLHPDTCNFSVLPVFWFHAWRIQAPHLDDKGELSYEA